MIANERTPRRRVTCSLCLKQGHNIRSCMLFETLKKEGIRQYQRFLYHAIVGEKDNWEFPPPNPDLDPIDTNGYESPSAELTQIFDTNKATNSPLENILDTRLGWIDNLDTISLKSLIYGFAIERNAPREQILSCLHHVFISEADSKWMYSYDTIYCIPYITQSCVHLDVLEENNAKILEHSIVLDHRNITPTLFSIQYRHSRIQGIYNQNRRIVRLQTREIQRFDRNIHELERRIQRINREINSVRSNQESVVNNRSHLIAELEMFPPDIIRKAIMIVQQKGEGLIDKVLDYECPICYNEIDTVQQVKTNCDHIFCINCVITHITTKYDEQKSELYCCCPMCRATIHTLYGDKQKIQKKLGRVIDFLKNFDDLKNLEK